MHPPTFLLLLLLLLTTLLSPVLCVREPDPAGDSVAADPSSPLDDEKTRKDGVDMAVLGEAVRRINARKSLSEKLLEELNKDL